MRRAAVLVGALLLSSVLGGCVGNFARIPRPAHTDRVGSTEPARQEQHQPSASAPRAL